MNYSNVLFLISDAVRAIRVAYEDNGRNNTIKKTFDKTVKVGDYVIVDTNTRWNMTVCKVSEVDVEVDFDSDDQLGWIIAKVDLDEFDSIKKQEETAIAVIKESEKRDKKEALRASIMRSAGSQLKALPSFNVDDTPEGKE